MMTFVISTSGTDRFKILGTGYVGIGTSTPVAPLQIAASGNSPFTNGLMVYNNSNSTNQDAIVTLRVGGSSAGDPFISFDIFNEAGWTFGIDNSDSNKMKWATGASNLSGTKMTLTTAGYLGIGTTNPTQKLQVNDGNILMSGAWSSGVYFSLMGYNNSKQIQFNYDDGTWISDNNSIRFGVGGSQSASGLYSEQMRITSGGDVGIGTTSPNYRLDVTGTMNITSGLYANGSAGSSGQVLTSSGGGAMSWATVSSGDIADYIRHTGNTSNDLFGFPNNNEFKIRTGGTDRLNIDSSGNVGIGVTNPGTPLQIAASGNSPFTNGLMVYNNSNSTNQDAIVTLRVGGSSAGDPFISFDIFNEAGWTFGIDNSDSNKMKWATGASNLTGTKMTMNTAGDLGIGTTSPGYKLDVQGTMQLTSGLRVSNTFGTTGQVLTSSGGGAMTWATVSSGGSSPWTTSGSDIYRSSGKVGIGNTNPGAPLQIECADTSIHYENGLLVKQSSTSYPAVIGIRTSNTTQDPFISFMINSNTTGWSYGVDASDSNKMKWGYDTTTWNSTRMTLTNDGKLGIGTTIPGYKLDVNGTMHVAGALYVGSPSPSAGTSGQVLTSTGGGAMMWTTVSGGGSSPWTTSGSNIYRSSGNVGIGITNPGAPLQIASSGNSNPLTNGILVKNSSNSTNQDSIVTLQVGGSGAGDPFISFDILGEAGWAFGIDNTDSNKLKWSTSYSALSSATRMTMTTAGDLGIGTTSPNYRLDVTGTMNITSGLYANGSAGSSGQVLTSSGGGVMTWTTVSGGGGGSSPWTTSGSDIIYNTGNVIIGSYITHDGDSDTYFGFPGSNQFVIRTGGTDRLNIDSVGRLTVPAYITHTGDTDTFFGFPSNDTFKITTSGTDRLRINSSGEVSIGNDSDIGSGHKMTVIDGSTSNNGSYADLVITNQSEHNNARLLLGTPHQTTSSSAFKAAIIADGAGTYSRNDLHFCLENSTDNAANADLTDSKMVIKYDTGNAGIGTTSPGYKLHVVGDIYATGNVTAYSDARNKKNLKTIEDPVSKIEKINGYTYEKDGIAYTGLVAQELLEVLPEAVCGSEELGYGIAYGNIAGIFVEAIKELNSKIKALENKLSQFV